MKQTNREALIKDLQSNSNRAFIQIINTNKLPNSPIYKLQPNSTNKQMNPPQQSQQPLIKLQQPQHFPSTTTTSTLKKNPFDLNHLTLTQQWPKLKLTRLAIAKHSIKSAIIRVHKQKTFQQSFDQIEIEELYDEKVGRNIRYQEYSSHYADGSCVNRGRFSSGGEVYGTVGSAGEGWVWDTRDVNDGKRFTEKITQLKTDVKMCDIAFHPRLHSIPVSAPNICTSTSNGQLLFWTFDPTLPTQKSFKLHPHTDRINSIDYHQTGNYLLCSSYDTTWSLFDATRLQQIYVQRGHQREIHCSALHPDGSLYFTGDLGGSGQVWDLRTGRGVFQVGEQDSILCCDFSPNGYQLALGGRSNMITIKDLRRLKTMKQIPAHTKQISSLKYAPNESILCSVSHDNTLKLWHGRNYISVNLQPHMHSSKVTSVDVCEGRVATTVIQRKWVMWVLKGRGGGMEEGEEGEAKLEEVDEEENDDSEGKDGEV